jgi:hypothetical protein
MERFCWFQQPNIEPIKSGHFPTKHREISRNRSLSNSRRTTHYNNHYICTFNIIKIQGQDWPHKYWFNKTTKKAFNQQTRMLRQCTRRSLINKPCCLSNKNNCVIMRRCKRRTNSVLASFRTKKNSNMIHQPINQSQSANASSKTQR